MKPLRLELAEKIHAHRDQVKTWFQAQIRLNTPPFYSSIDLRNAGFKIGPVDCNLFPAGWNNVCEQDQNSIRGPLLKQLPPGTKRILFLPELNTRNPFYLENVASFVGFLEKAGLETRIGWPDPSQTHALDLVSQSGKKFRAEPLDFSDPTALKIGDWTPDVILLNNDFSSGEPTFLKTVQTPILPPYWMGWYRRKKGAFFKAYNNAVADFCKMIAMDPWPISIDTVEVAPVNFNESQGLESVAQTVDTMLAKMREQYAQRSIDLEPQVFVKSYRGTYGMGVLVVKKGEDVLSLNRREKNKMSVGKNRLAIDGVIVQEAIPTDTKFEERAAEPVIYLLGCELVGGFLRTHRDRGTVANLNSEGMILEKLCMSALESELQKGIDPQHPQHDMLLKLVVGSIARLSSLAAGIEIAASRSQTRVS